ncbi:hypothetical protein Bca4012_019623 [Brassica carinata]
MDSDSLLPLSECRQLPVIDFSDQNLTPGNLKPKKKVKKSKTSQEPTPSQTAAGDSSLDEYNFALETSVADAALWCDLQLTKDGAGMCFPGLIMMEMI